MAGAVIASKSQVRDLERAVIDFHIEGSTGDGLRRLRAGALERELAESLRRSYSLIRRFVRVGTGMHRAKSDSRVSWSPIISD